MFKRRDALKFGLAAAGTGLASPHAFAAANHARRPFAERGLVFPDTRTPSVVARPSPPARSFVTPLFVLPDAREASEVRQTDLDPPPDPDRHQRYNDFLPQRYFRETFREKRWQYHIDAPYNQGSIHIGWDAGHDIPIRPGAEDSSNPPDPGFFLPGQVYRVFYDEPIFVRRVNDMPPIGEHRVVFTNPSFTVHLHNAHTASESDGIPTDYFNPGEFWDYHYGNFLAGFDEKEKMSSLWYHDHRLDFTATNVYGGISAPYLLFDEFDSNDERDPNPNASRLPSGPEFDIPLMVHDVQFDEDGEVVWDFGTPGTQQFEDVGEELFPSFQHTTFGMLGDQLTVNRKIRPFHDVKQRKYRLRIYNGGPSRLYRFSFQVRDSEGNFKRGPVPVTQLTEDGNFFDEPKTVEEVELWVANRADVVVDFSEFEAGDQVILTNHLEMRSTGEGPSGRRLELGDPLSEVMMFQVTDEQPEDPSRVPERLISGQPTIDFREVRRERLFTFDYDNGLFTVDGRLMDPNRVDAAIEQGSAEIWTFRNEGLSWGHPIHTHFEEFQIFEVNGQPIDPTNVRDAKKDVVRLGPGDEIKFFSRWRDFFGRHVMHCHNVVHEDHAMMIRWDIVPPGEGD